MKQAGEEIPYGFIGRAPAIVRLRGYIEQLARSRAPVLIHGESGTGKEVVARSLYNANPRGNFVPVDCGSLVGPLMESELFGHARHAFTGAGEAKRGLMDVANGGTAFFDEIGDLPFELQVKLLRLVQEREFRPVGSLHRVKIDIRILAATHRDLQKEIAAGRFREDLFHRLNVVRLTVPPLRERKEDIPLLIDAFLKDAPTRFILTNEAKDAMMAYDWPGNIRELKNALDRMMALNDGPLLHLADLPSSIVNHGRRDRGLTMAMTVDRPPTNSFAIGSLQEMERMAICNALAYTKGDRTVAAQMLGIGRTTLYRKLKEYQLE